MCTKYSPVPCIVIPPIVHHNIFVLPLPKDVPGAGVAWW